MKTSIQLQPGTVLIMPCKNEITIVERYNMAMYIVKDTAGQVKCMFINELRKCFIK